MSPAIAFTMIMSNLTGEYRQADGKLVFNIDYEYAECKIINKYLPW